MPLSKIVAKSITDDTITTDQIADTSVHGARNRLINGDFQVWQRSTSSSSNGYKTADRWFLNLSGGSATASQGTFTDGQTAVPGNPRFYMALNVTTGNDNCGWQYRIEGTHEFANDVYTLSFWAKSATPREMTVKGQSHDLSTDVTQDNTVSPTTFTPTSSWQKFTFKVTHSSMNTLGSFASGDFTRISINQGSDTSTAAWKLDLALVQYEKGETATPFEHRSYGDEELKCFRFYYDSKKANSDNASYYYAPLHRYDSHVKGVTWEFATAQHPVRMRASPTITLIDGNGNTGKISHWTSGGGNQTHNHNAYTTESKELHVTISDYSTSGIYGFYANYIADAEL